MLNLKIIHQNFQGLMNKLDIFEDLLNSESPDLICVSEHFLKEECITSIKVHGYTCASAFCRKTSIKGGVCIFVKNNISFKVLKVSKYCVEKKCEIVAITINVLNNQIIVIGVYRPPSNEIDVFFDKFLECLDQIKINEKTIIMGDFNIDFMKTNSPITNRFVNLMKTYGLESRILNYTREFKQSRSLIDNIFTNVSNHDFQSSVLKAAISDHHVAMGILKLFEKENENLFYFTRTYKKAKIDQLKRDLSLEKWQPLLSDELSLDKTIQILSLL
jgi:exonuclease III